MRRQETRRFGLGATVGRLNFAQEEAAAVDRHIDGWVALLHNPRQLEQPIVHVGRGWGRRIGLGQLTLGFIADRPGRFRPSVLRVVRLFSRYPPGLADRQQVTRLGVEQEEQAIEQRERAAKHLVEAFLR